MANDNPPNPLVIFAPYLPLTEPVTAGGWWIGPLSAFPGPWLNERFEGLARRLIADYTTQQGEPVPNPALVVSAERGADGTRPGNREWRALQLALDLTVLDGNPPLNGDARRYAGWTVATTDNSQIHLWPVDLEHGAVARSAGFMVEVRTAGYTIESGFNQPASQELHWPRDRSLDGELLAALLATFRGAHDETDARLADRLAVTAAWLSQVWRNTVSIRFEERIVMLKTGFEALTGTSNSRASSQALEARFRTLPLTPLQDRLAEYLLWKPSETPTMTWHSQKGKPWAATPLQHWFMSFADCRNTIIHGGRLESADYHQDGSAYNGPYLFVGERVLREACRVALATFGYSTLWKPPSLRLLSEALRPLFERLQPEIKPPRER